jgi:hypothetical protein
MRLVIGVHGLTDRRQVVARDNEQAALEGLLVLLVLVSRDLGTFAFPHALQVREVVVVERSLEVELMRRVDLRLPRLVGRVHYAVALLEVEFSHREDLLDETDESGLAGVAFAMEPNEALLGVLPLEEELHNCIEAGLVTSSDYFSQA